MINLRQIALALDNYHEDHGTFPPAYIADEHGVPIHSWRVLLLPYLEEQALFGEYRFDEPWNGPNNRKLASKIPYGYQCPSHGHHGEAAGEFVTNYVVVVGPHAIFRGETPTTITDITDGESQTIIVVDVNQQAVNWMAPDDISVDEFISLFHDDSEFNHPVGTNIVFADGSVSFVSQDMKPNVLNALLTNQSNDESDIEDQ